MRSVVSPTTRPLMPWSLLFVAPRSARRSGLPGRRRRAQAQPDRQMPPVTFRVEVNYVEVDAIVIDKQGDFVGDLQPGDFQVLEDGKPQAVSAFGLVRIPLERPEAPLFVTQPIEPDVQSNVRPFDGRVYLIVLDELHTSALHTLVGPGRREAVHPDVHRGQRRGGRRQRPRGRPTRTSPATSACCSPQSTGSSAERASVGDAEQDRRLQLSAPAAGRRHRTPWPIPTTPIGPTTRRRRSSSIRQLVRLHVGRPGAAQGDGALQRGASTTTSPTSSTTRTRPRSSRTRGRPSRRRRGRTSACTPSIRAA